MQAVRRDSWKLVRHDDTRPWELYNLDRDLGERNDLAGRHPEVVRSLDRWVHENRTPPPPQTEPDKPAGKRYR
jgi:hypothetical protein